MGCTSVVALLFSVGLCVRERKLREQERGISSSKDLGPLVCGHSLETTIGSRMCTSAISRVTT